VVYAGRFRSYGQLLILNADGGCHVLLGGMERISVDLGQFVLTGDPVAAMDGGSQASPTGTSGPKQPVLYVEFRKDGAPIDPSPWWAKRRRKGSRMMRKTSLLFLGALAGVLTTLLITQPRVLLAGSAARAAVSDTYRGLNLFGDVFERVRADYVERPDDSKLVESAINGMLAGLDPHSSYMDPKSFRDIQVQTRGEFGGLGIEATMEEGLVKVVAPIDETPAAKAGVMANDVITHLDDEAVQGLTLNQAVDKMRGPVNTKIKLTIMRKGAEKPIEVTIVRDIIRVKSVRWHPEGSDIGYIRITQFNEQTTDGLKQAINDLNAQLGADKVKGYVVDLRNNPGGLLDQAISVSDTFLEKGEIVSTRGRNPKEMQRFNARPGDMTKGKRVIVLINGGSASASEIVAGALQDNKRATLIGTRSFGKGSVQTIIPLGAGNGALRLTTARYYTASGRSIQAKGISPDIEVLQDVPDNLKAQTDSKGEASLRGHLKAQGSEETGSQSYVPPNESDDKAIKMALDLLRGTASNAAFPSKPKAAVPN
jgi:carboxyl-terminal processing protease